MEFADQIKKIREERNLTQEQLSQKLNVSRQAISNWENRRNLPDIEMLITIASVFHVSLDQLILGGNDMEQMKQKLIKDGSETRRAKMNLASIRIGSVLLLFGVACILIKANSVEYIDANGFLHENFFLLPIGFLFIFSGIITFLVAGASNIVSFVREKKQNNQQ